MSKDSIEVSNAVRVLESIEARELRNMVTASSFTDLKKELREKFDRDLSRRENLSFEEKKPITMKELSSILGVAHG